MNARGYRILQFVKLLCIKVAAKLTKYQLQIKDRTNAQKPVNPQGFEQPPN